MKNKTAQNHTDELNELLKESFLEMDFETNNNQHFIDMIATTYSQPSFVINWKSILKKHEIAFFTTSIVAVVIGIGGFYQTIEKTPNYLPSEIGTIIGFENDSLETFKAIDNNKDYTLDYIAPINTPPLYNEAKPLPVLEKKTLKLKSNFTTNEIDTFRMPSLTKYEKELLEDLKPEILKNIYKLNKRIYSSIPRGEFEWDGKLIPVNEFYLQTREVSNIDYKIFLFDLIKNRRENDYRIAAPVTSKWEKYGGNTNPYIQYYFSHQAYSNYPVVNITREAALLYCAWLSEEYERAYSDARKSRVINFYLPTDIEWMYAASSGGKFFPYPWGGPYLRNSKGEFLANHQAFKDERSRDQPEMLAPAHAYYPNEFGLYNMSGNAAEMITYHDTKEVGTKGGSWKSIAENIKIKAEDPFRGYRDADPEIGFRVAFTYLSR